MMTKSLFQCKCFQRWLIGVYLLVSTPTQGCDNLLGLDDCIDPNIYKDRWKMINEEKCGTEQDNVMHCQKLQIGNICSVCATRKMCPAGTYAHIETLTKSVSCEPCTQGWYQREPKASYHFKTPSCDSKQTDCKDRKIVCLIGSAFEDNKCQCDHRAGYRPTEEGCRCFDFNSLCECTIAQCPGGTKIDSNYNCIPVPTVRTETNKTTNSPADIGKSSEPEESALKIEGIVGIVIAVLFASLLAGPYLWYKIDQRNKKEKIGFLSWLCHKRHPRSKKEKSSAPESSDGRNLHTSEGSPLVLSNGTARSNEGSAPESSDGRNLHTSEGSPLVLSNGTARSNEGSAPESSDGRNLHTSEGAPLVLSNGTARSNEGSAPESSDGRNLHTSEGAPLVLSNGTARSVEECKTKGPIVEISSDDTPEMVLNTPYGDLVREKALHVVREENLKYQLASKPTNLTQTINASKVNMVYGDHGCIRQEMIPFERRESSDMSSLEADGGDERQNHPMLSSDDEQEPRNSLFVNVDQAGTSQRPGD